MRRTILLLFLVVPLFAGEFSYVYIRPQGSATVSRGSLAEVLRIRDRYSGELLWAKVDGRAYLIRDAAVLAEVRRAFGPLEALHREQQEPLRRKMHPLENRMEALEKEIDVLSDADDLTRSQEARLRELEGRLRDLESQLRPFEAQERRLDEREEVLDRAFDAEVNRIVTRSIRSGIAKRAP